MKNIVLRKVLLLVALGAAVTVNAQNEAIESGPYSATWDGLSAWECPEWFKDAKFGIWAHWGPQCQAEYGDWYARHMYQSGSSQYNYHCKTFGNPKDFGLKDLCDAWKADKWDPDALIKLYKDVGAKYFMALGQHHDNFDCWDSPYQEWNSVNVGPKKDLLKGWSDACRKYGLHLGVSMHGTHAWSWLEPAQDFDGKLTKADGYTLNSDGTEKWWKGLDPQELYAQDHVANGLKWDWGSPTTPPSEAYKMKFQNRVIECINDYNPDLLYFDDSVIPFWGVDEQIGLNIIEHYYNHSANANGGKSRVVVTGKKLLAQHKKSLLWDVERGVPSTIQADYWQTCSCIGDWHYKRSLYTSSGTYGGYKTPTYVINMLVDIVSKNGNLLLSVPVRGDGSIDSKEQAVLSGIKAWMDINGEGVFGTRPWKQFGEGPLYEASLTASSSSSSESNSYSSSDIFFTQRNDTLYATIMRWPDAGTTVSLKSLGMSQKDYKAVKKIELLGYDGEIEHSTSLESFNFVIPSNKPNDICPMFRITFADKDSGETNLQELIDMLQSQIVDMSVFGYNTGKYGKSAVSGLAAQIEEARKYVNADETVKAEQAARLLDLARSLKTYGGGQPDTSGSTDITTEQLIESQKFTASSMGSRFGTPKYWTVENFNIPMKTTSKGNKNGIDNNPGYNCLYLGVWYGEDAASYTSDVSNARIYRKVHLPAGRYYFGSRHQNMYHIAKGYIFAADDTMKTDEIPQKSIAYYSITDAVGGDGNFYGVYFTIEKEQDVLLGFQCDLKQGVNKQETRIAEVKLLKYADADPKSVQNLVDEAKTLIGNVVIDNNTGHFSQTAVDALNEAITEGERIDENSTADEIYTATDNMKSAISVFQDSRNKGGLPEDGEYTDLTVSQFVEGSGFTRVDDSTTRFSKPKYWTVENYSIPMLNTSKGVKEGIDNYPGYDCLYLGVWSGEDATTYTCDVANARLYRKVHLAAGRYYFGAEFNETYGMNDVTYLFASDGTVGTADIPAKTLAYYPVKSCTAGDGNFYGLYFQLENEQDVLLGFQGDLSQEKACTEFRVSAVTLLRYGEEDPTNVEDVYEKPEGNAPAAFYSLQGVRLKSAPQHGLFILRQGNRAVKMSR